VFTYKATNTLNGKFYIGSTLNFECRKRQHMSSRRNYPFQNALRKNPEAFEWEVVEDPSEEPTLEQALLDMWFGTEMCYNLNKYACGGCAGHSKETKQKMSRQRKGKPLSMRNREALSKSRKGMKFSEEHKQNISLGKTGKSHAPWNRGKTWYYNLDTSETKMFVDNPGEGWIKGRKP
jgi:group I intron endonuclease